MSMTVSEQDAATATSAGPWIGYESQGVGTIVAFVRKSTPTQVRAVQTFERAHLDRAEVHAAAELRLAKWHC